MGIKLLAKELLENNLAKSLKVIMYIVCNLGLYFCLIIYLRENLLYLLMEERIFIAVFGLL